MSTVVDVSPKSSMPEIASKGMAGPFHSPSSLVDVSAEPDSKNTTDSESASKKHQEGRYTKSRRRRARTHRHHPAQHTLKVLDGVRDGYNMGFRKKCVESFLILGLLVLAAKDSWTTVIANKQFITVSSSVLLSVLMLRQASWTMPSVLYIYLFPIILTLADYPQYLRLNILLSLSSLPLPSEILSNLLILLSPETPQIYYLHSNVVSVVKTLTTTSLSPAETSLAGTVLVNLFLNAKEMDMVFLRAFMFGSLFCLWPAAPLIHKVMDLSSLPRHRRPANSENLKLRLAYGVYAIFVFNVLVFVRWHLEKTLGIDPFVYIFHYLFSDDGARRRQNMLAYWAMWLVIGIPWIQKSSVHWTIDMRRKVWHGMVVGMFLVGGVGFDAPFTSLSMSIALTLFLLSEFLRTTTLPPLGSVIHLALKRYTDERDSCGPIIVSHIFLLLGISLPIFWSSSPAGIICLGFGDACASIVGRRFGKHRWFGSQKTLEGTAAFIVAAFTGLMATKYALPGYTDIFGRDLSIPWALLVATSTAILEATSGMNDNVIVPVYMYVILRLGTRSRSTLSSMS